MTGCSRSVAAIGAALLAISSSMAQEPTPIAFRPVEEPEAYAVYAVVLPAEQWKAHIVQAESGMWRPCVSSGAEFERWRDVVEDFLRENEHTRLLLPQPPLVAPYSIASKAEIEASFRGIGPPAQGANFGRGLGPWAWFYERFPDSGGYAELSAVGFDEAKDRAMVYVAHHCGMLCGGGRHHLLEKTDRAWREVTSWELAGCMWAN